MGQRGPAPKPLKLKLLEGNPGKRPINLADGVNPPVEVPTAPKFIKGSALKEWKRVTPLLVDLGLISKLDMAALAMYCQSYGRWHDLEIALQKKIALICQKDGIDECVALERACTLSTPSGYKQQSVLFQLIRSAKEEVNRSLSHFGLSPSQRARVQPSSQFQQSLPGMEDSKQSFAQFR